MSQRGALTASLGASLEGEGLLPRSCEHRAMMWERTSCDQTASGTAVCWGTPVAWAFLHRLLFLVLGPMLHPLPLHVSSQPLGYGHALASVKEKKSNPCICFVFSL